MLATLPLIVVPFSKSEVAVAAGQARHWVQSRHTQDFNVLLVADVDVDQYSLWSVVRHARNAFKSVQVVQPPFKLDTDRKLSLPNWLVQTAIMRFVKTPEQELLMIPPDCMTMRPEWMGLLKIGKRARMDRSFPIRQSVKSWLKMAGHHNKDWFLNGKAKGFEVLESGDAIGKQPLDVGIIAGAQVKSHLEALGKHASASSKIKDRIRMRRWAAIGDVIASTSVARKLYENGFEVHLETFSACAEAVLHSPYVSSVSENGGHDFNLDLAYENHPLKAQKHICEIFIESANRQLKERGINLGDAQNFAPVLLVTGIEREWAQGIMGKYSKPWTVICPRAHMTARTLPASVVAQLVGKIPGTLFWCSDSAAPEGLVDLKVRKIRDLMAYIEVSDIVLSVDSAPLHIAAGLRKPTVAIRQSFDPSIRISNQRDVTIINRGDLECLPCNQYMCIIDKDKPPCGLVDPMLIANTLNAKLEGIFGETVSAIIPVWRPNVGRLNRCLNAILAQVDEVVIGVDGDGIVPQGVMKSPKIKWTKHKVPNRMGYGKTCNMAARESSGRYLLMLNDDCFAAPTMVVEMKKRMGERVGVVGGLLWHPDKTVQHGGTRFNGNNFMHIDGGQRTPSIRTDTEMKFVTFASALVRRKVFFEVDGFDERYDLYFEDSDFCLKASEAGWKVIYTPEAQAVHEVSQTSKGMIGQFFNASNKIFQDKWQHKFAELSA